MELALKISEDDFAVSVTEERLLDYLQFLLNAVAYVTDRVTKEYSFYMTGDTVFNAITDNSLQIIDRLGAELINDDRKGELYIVYRDDVATTVAEQNSDLAPSLIEYLKIDNRHDLVRKGEVLCTLAKKLEPHEKRLCGTEFKSLCEDTTFLLNNIGARHYHNPGNKIDAQFINMGDEDLEKWYDRAFQMLLSCMSVLPYLDYKTEIKELRKGNVQ